MHTDRAIIHVKGGHGGPGSSSFRREKFIPKGGPDGGNGGDGGNIVIQANQSKQTLMDLTLKKKYVASNGQPGKGKKQFGSSGKHTIIEVPIGTVVTYEDKIIADLTYDQQSIIVAKGGKGGRGNVCFANSINKAPTYAQPGLPGEEKLLDLELKMIAQVGIIGLPNAGKSTLLQALTRAQPKIASYPFTTLYPNLGILKNIDREIIIADIPGLISGAAEGHGLGHAFLRHIERTQLLLHLVAADSNNPEVLWDNYTTILNELSKASIDINTKNIVTALSKIDIMETNIINDIVTFFDKKGVHLLVFSSHTHQGLESLIKELLYHDYSF